jgi:hypothetical protein
VARSGGSEAAHSVLDTTVVGVLVGDPSLRSYFWLRSETYQENVKLHHQTPPNNFQKNTPQKKRPGPEKRQAKTGGY